MVDRQKGESPVRKRDKRGKRKALDPSAPTIDLRVASGSGWRKWNLSLFHAEFTPTSFTSIRDVVGDEYFNYDSSDVGQSTYYRLAETKKRNQGINGKKQRCFGS